MNNRETRAGIAQDTLAILAAGRYRNGSGTEVSIAGDLARSVASSVHYTGDELELLANKVEKKQSYATRFEVRNESTLAAARRLASSGHLNPLCLNFASAKNPGGGFLGGSEAQEENLAKSSGLYPCILQMTEMYTSNRTFGSCVYRDDMIYSPAVPVFRDDAYRLTDEFFLASFVTAPAVNRGAIARNEPERLSELDAIMAKRIDKLLAIALYHGHTVLVLGAWGCGVFGNLPTDMARWFSAHLLNNPVYRDAFEVVCFAVLDTKNNGTFAAFDSEFAGVTQVHGT